MIPFCQVVIAELAPGAGLIVAGLAYLFWSSQLRQYQSAGH